MSIKVENNLKNADKKDVFDQKAHFMPCKIDEDGEANVKQYFEHFVKENLNGELTASFRGHPLDGVRIKVPDEYRAIVATEAKRPLSEESERRFQVAGGFKEFTHWNWDKKPSKNDNIMRAMDWIDIAECIHGD